MCVRRVWPVYAQRLPLTMNQQEEIEQYEMIFIFYEHFVRLYVSNKRLLSVFKRPFNIIPA